MDVTSILKGHLKELLGQGQSLADARMKICVNCPLYKMTAIGPTCNPALYLNPVTNETSGVGKEGFYRGCGCRLNAKTRLEDAECPAKKW